MPIDVSPSMATSGRFARISATTPSTIADSMGAGAGCTHDESCSSVPRLDPGIQRLHEPLVGSEICGRGPEAAVAATQAGQACPRVEQPDEAGPRSVEVRREQEGRRRSRRRRRWCAARRPSARRRRSWDRRCSESVSMASAGVVRKWSSSTGLVAERAQSALGERGHERLDVRSCQLVREGAVVPR